MLAGSRCQLDGLSIVNWQSSPRMKESQLVGLVTGASRGIGASIVSLFRDRGWVVLGTSRTPNFSNELRLDVRDESSVEECFKAVISKYGRLDLLVNNAGIVTQSSIINCTRSEWQEVIDTNLTGAFLCAKQAIQHFLRNGGGSIINVSSIAGHSYSATASEAYTCSKYGMIGLTKQLAQRYASGNIRVNCVCPSQTLTPMLEGALSEERRSELASRNPSGRLAHPEDVARAVWFLASNEADYVNGAVLDVNGGAF